MDPKEEKVDSVEGKFATAIIYAKTLEETARKQIELLCDQEIFQGSNPRVMPDSHAGKGCVIGFTAILNDIVVPYLIGFDIGCGMRTSKLGKIDIDYESLDNFIRQNIPCGFKRNKIIDEAVTPEFYDEIMVICHKLQAFYGMKLKHTTKQKQINNLNRLIDSLEPQEQAKAIGSLGGGNHFIEVNEDSENNKYLVVHSGSRNFGLQVCNYHQQIAKFNCEGKNVQKDLEYLTGEDKEFYLMDMQIAQRFAELNREVITGRILSHLGMEDKDSFDTVHNYIDFENNIMRKGAISAYEGEKVLIPLNMRDGSIIAVGKGNEEWNYSAPHGAGRIMGRKQAERVLDFDEYKETMKDVWTSSVCKDTIDEAPMAYKPADEIIEAIQDTVDIVDIIKPLYNFKAKN
ncbi:RtcB family protein [Nanoarchaeota archaeon]